MDQVFQRRQGELTDVSRHPLMPLAYAVCAEHVFKLRTGQNADWHIVLSEHPHQFFVKPRPIC